MPGAFAHIGFAEQFAQRKDVKEALPQGTTHPNYLAFGAMGPDFLFFHPDDWPILSTFYDPLHKIYEDLGVITAFYNKISSVLKKAQETGEDLVGWATGGAWTSFETTANAIKTTTAAHIAKMFLEKVDLFALIEPPMHANHRVVDRPKWWWIDLGHHHKTGDLLSYLWQTATTEEQRAYCLGYSTHIAADVIGHAHVNALCGGPYRNHWRRHVLVEKVMDCHLWHLWYGTSLSGSKVYEKMEIFDSSGVLGLPEDFQDWLANGLSYTYGDIKSGVSGSTVDFMYRSFFKFGVKDVSGWSLLNFPAPEDFEWFDLPDFVQDHLNTVLSKKPSISLPSGGLTFSNVKSFLKSLAEGMIWVTEVIVTIATIPVASLARLTTAHIRYLLWLLVNEIYDLYTKARIALALGGYLHPEPAWNEKYFSSILRPSPDTLGRWSEAGVWDSIADSKLVQHQQYHLTHASGSELNMGVKIAAKEDPHAYLLGQYAQVSSGVTPDLLFKEYGNVAGAQSLVDAALSSNDVAINNARQYLTGIPDLALRILDRGLGDVPNWNLDADRGYAYPLWETNSHRPWISSEIVLG